MSSKNETMTSAKVDAKEEMSHPLNKLLVILATVQLVPYVDYRLKIMTLI